MRELSRPEDWLRWINDAPNREARLEQIRQIQKEAVRRSVEYQFPLYTVSDVPQHVIEREVKRTLEVLMPGEKTNGQEGT